jgi:hypothetical protein
MRTQNKTKQNTITPTRKRCDAPLGTSTAPIDTKNTARRHRFCPLHFERYFAEQPDRLTSLEPPSRPMLTETKRVGTVPSCCL